MKLEEIPIRDPYIFADNKSKKYYLFGSIPERRLQTKFIVYLSDDLIEWSNPKTIFEKNDKFWGITHFWAPELHYIDGKYCLFATFMGEQKCNRCQILVSDTPDGVYEPVGEPITPDGWSALDATFYRENDKRYMVFCHEWKDLGCGEMCLSQLDKNLKPYGDVVTLFKATDAKWVVNASTEFDCFVTDGPFIVKTENKLVMIWSSFSKNGYAVACATADAIDGPWIQWDKPLFDNDGGHGMVFTDFNGEKHLVFHNPNKNTEHAVMFDVVVEDNGIKIK